MRILIVEDDRNLRKVLTNELFAEGSDVVESANGSETMDLLEKEEITGNEVLQLVGVEKIEMAADHPVKETNVS